MGKFSAVLAGVGLVFGGLVAGPALPAGAASCPAAVAPQAATDDGTAGTEANPFLITSVAEMQHLLGNLNAGTGKFFRLTQDIDYKIVSADQTIRCNVAVNEDHRDFMGTFDGGGNTISNFDAFGTIGAGLFPRVANAVIKNLVIDGAQVFSGVFAGALAGDIRDTTLQNITVKNSFVGVSGLSTTTIAGGIAGEAIRPSGSATLSQLRVLNTSVTADRFSGGMFGQTTYPVITEVAVLGTIVSTSGKQGVPAEVIGGIIGRPLADLQLSKASFQGAIILNQEELVSAGLLIGDALGTAVDITDSSARGVLTAYAGVDVLSTQPVGLVGARAANVTVTRAIVQAKFEKTRAPNITLPARQFLPADQGTVSSSFYDSAVHTNWAVDIGAAAKTTAQLTDPATYASGDGWAVTTDVTRVVAGTATETWLIANASDSLVEDGFPVHTWLYEGVTAELLDPCQIGFYRPAAIGLSLGCLPAEPGTFVAFTNAVEATQCPPGRYQYSYAVMFCLDAEPGFFVEGFGATAQVTCPAGFTSDAAAASCFPIPEECQPGTFSATGFSPCGEAEPGRFVAASGATEAVPCPPGRYQPNAGASACLPAEPGFFVGTSGAIAQEPCPAGFTSTTAEATECTRVAAEQLGGGGFVPPVVPEAEPEVVAAPAEARGWTRAMADRTVKFYARDLVGAGKVQFMLNGREVAWVRAVDATDPKLNVGPAAARDGLVRTVGPGTRWSLVAGRNVLEIYVEGVRLVRRVFTQ